MKMPNSEFRIPNFAGQECPGSLRAGVPRDAVAILAVDLSGDEAVVEQLVELARLYTNGNAGAMARLLLLQALNPLAFHDELEWFQRRRAA